MEDLPDFVLDKSVFNHLEGTHYEFKSSFAQNRVKKYAETLGAFLNSGGGYLLFGIRDDGYILGVPEDRKLIDNIKLFTDTTLRNIITSDGTAVPVECIHVKVLSVQIADGTGVGATGRVVVAIICKPVTGYVYQLGGQVYVRANASNSCFKCLRYYSEEEMHNMRANLSKEHNTIMKRAIEFHTTEMARMETELNKQKYLLNEEYAKYTLMKRQNEELYTYIDKTQKQYQNEIVKTNNIIIVLAIIVLFGLLGILFNYM